MSYRRVEALLIAAHVMLHRALLAGDMLISLVAKDDTSPEMTDAPGGADDMQSFGADDVRAAKYNGTAAHLLARSKPS